MMKKNHLYAVLMALLLGSCSSLKLFPSKKIQQIEFDQEGFNESYHFIYQNLENSPGLKVLKETYRLDSISSVGNSELEKILVLLNWTNNRWEHNGSNQPTEPNALTILEEAAAGKKFRCVEYGVVLRSVLAANGFYARTLGLMTRDVETTRIGAGHVLTEVWSNTYNKWFLLDPQFNIVPVQDGRPLNAVEFQSAIIHKSDVKLIDFNGEASQERQAQYLKFIPPYLYYFDFKFDQREVKYDSLIKVNDKAILMLVPKNASKPVIFQRKIQMDYLEYTHSLNDFYRKP